MQRTVVLLVALGIFCDSGRSQATDGKATAPAARPAADLASGLAQRLGDQLHATTIVGEPVKAGTVTLIPILLVDVNFAGASAPAPAPNAQGLDAFLMSGEARPLGFVVVTAKGTRFIRVGDTPAK